MTDNNHNNKAITDDVVSYVARLSRLSLENESVSKFRDQLAKILEYVAQLDEVDTTATLPTTHVLSSMKDVFREDEPGRSLSQEEALKNAPEKHDGFFKIPSVM